LIGIAVLIGFVLAFFPTEAFIIDTAETPYYIIPRVDAVTGT
jgi:hypothetical protein